MDGTKSAILRRLFCPTVFSCWVRTRAPPALSSIRRPWAGPLKALAKRTRTPKKEWSCCPMARSCSLTRRTRRTRKSSIRRPFAWTSAGSAMVNLSENAGEETGPALLRPDGTVFAMGANGRRKPGTPRSSTRTPGKWAAGPDFPNGRHGRCSRCRPAGWKHSVRDQPAGVQNPGFLL